MSNRSPVTSGDLSSAALMCATSVRKLDQDLWSKPAYGLEWTRSRTVSHIADALSFYSQTLATRVQENPGSRGLLFKEGSVEASAIQIENGAAVLLRVAEATPAGTRIYNPTGNPDVEGLLAMGCVEILLHGYDAVAGTDAEFDPDNELCKRVLSRLFPWAPLVESNWLTLLWATGRRALDGHEFLGESWVWHNDLLSEWEGTIPRHQAWIGRK
ncbi:MAG: hypothetical protein O3B95_09485 [Chloroflexi bacterium]|nr:hypothetical protein [Chloroflexota bacterium]